MLGWGSRTIGLLLSATLIISSIAAAEEKPHPYTWHDYRAALLDLNHQTLAGAYQAHATHGAWDADAIKFLDRMAVYFANGSVDTTYKKDLNTHDELIAAGKALIAAGCKDPLVAYCYGAVLHDSGKPNDGAKHVAAAVKGLEKAGYPSMRVAAAAGRLQKLISNQTRQAELQTLVAKHFLEIASGKLTDIQRRYAVDTIWDMLERRPGAEGVAFVDALRNRNDADPWVLNVLTGQLEIKLAWDSRGSGVAGTVTEDGWKGFHEHLSKSRDSFVAAQTLAPQLPEAAKGMITVAMGDGEALGEEVGPWFDRAIAAQFDYAPAYGVMFYAVTPRWGGSYAQMYDVGIRGMQTGRYDTDAPWQLLRAVEKIGDEEGRSWGVLSEPTIYEALCFVMDQYAAVRDKETPKAWYATFRGALAWRAEKYEDARKALEPLGERVDYTAFQRVGSKDPPAAIGHAILMGGDKANEVRAAEEALRDKKYDEALKKFQSLLPATEGHPLAKPYLDARIMLVDRRAKLENGEPYDVQPKASLAGWRKRAGIWKVDENGTLICEALQYTSALIHEEPLAPRFELSGIFEPIGSGGGRPGVALGRGTSTTIFYVVVGNGSLYLYGPNNFKEEIVVEALKGLSGPQPFVMNYEFGRMSLSVGGKEVLSKHAVPVEIMADVRAGLGASGSVRFSELKIRNLTKDAAKAVEAK